jgi:sulfate adenylyltransferase (ADP) / ATP adenylyltransferase
MNLVEQYEAAIFSPGTLWARVQMAARRALDSGDLQPILTDFEHVEDGDIRFLVRIIRHLARKPCQEVSDVVPAAKRTNPFLPYDSAMHVADASPTHVCLLNKFNVVERHLLIVTRAFEDQETPLTQLDFEALWTCLAEAEGLGFYNSGAVAGASQRHKHLQLVPLPLDPSGVSLPIAPLVEAAGVGRDVVRLDSLPFPHAIAALDSDAAASPQHAAALTLDLYRRLLQSIGVTWPGAGERFSKPYNLLVTRRWMLAVPRTRECVEAISCNSLAFAGAWLVRDRQQLETLKRVGPLAALRGVTEQ